MSAPLSTDLFYLFTYDDGSREVLKLRPWHLALAEEHLGGLTERTAFRAVLYAAYRATPHRGMPFESWAQTVANFDVSESDPDAPAPADADVVDGADPLESAPPSPDSQ